MRTEYVLKHGGSVVYKGYILDCERTRVFTGRAKWVFWGKSCENDYDAVGPFDTLAECRRAIDPLWEEKRLSA